MEYRSWTKAGFVGGLAFIIGYIITALLLIVHPVYDLRAPVLGGYDTTDKIGLMLYHSHFVSTSEGFALFAQPHIVKPLLANPNLFLAVPVVVLILAGVLTVSWQEPSQLSLPEAASSGAKIATGYGILALLGVAVFSVDMNPPIGGPIMRPDVGETILLMGFAYPLIFGGLGGLIAAYWYTR